jgi:hypothetical protein
VFCLALPALAAVVAAVAALRLPLMVVPLMWAAEVALKAHRDPLARGAVMAVAKAAAPW